MLTRCLAAPHLPLWLARHLRPTDGPGAGRRLTLEPWQRGFLHAVDREHKTIVSLMAASQIGKTLIALGIGIRAAVDGSGVLMASSTEVSVRDLARRLDSTLEHAPALGTRFPSPRSGPGARASWKDRTIGRSRFSSGDSTPRAHRWGQSSKSFDGRTGGTRSCRGAERGDPRALATFRNTVLGMPGESGGADVDRLYERRGSSGPLAIEQVTVGIDVQTDRLVYVVCGFTAQNAIVQVVHFGVVLGDPRDDHVWDTLAADLDTHRTPIPCSVVSVDAGFLTATVKSQCARHRWWIPTVGRAGTGQAIARPIGQSGLAVLGKDDAAAWWTGRIDADRVKTPQTISRKEIGELLAAEALTAEAGALRWRQIEQRENHYWDSALLAIHARHFRPLTAGRRPFRVVAV